MRVVLDTNILVSAYLSPLGPPAQILNMLLSGRLVAVLDERILLEYKQVICRPSFQIAQQSVEWLIDYLCSEGEFVPACVLNIKLLDPDDLPFLEVAASGHVDYLVTGNSKHLPATVTNKLAVRVLTPFELLKLL